MRDQRKNKMIFIGILALVVGSITIGFAAFSNVLTIRSSATVNPDPSTFNVSLSCATDSIDKSCEIAPTSDNTSVATNSSKASISADGKTLSNIGAAFTEPGQSVSYTVHAYNAGQYTAWVQEHGQDGVNSTSNTRVCTAGEGTSQELADAVCHDSIALLYTIGEFSSFGAGTHWYSSAPPVELKLGKQQYHDITITIKYKDGGARADGPFTVEFGDMYFNYGTTSPKDYTS